MSDLVCADVRALSAELALGILTGDERADALRHLNACPACQHHVEALARVADELLLVAPEQEPPIGFEARVLERVAAERQTAAAGSGPASRARWRPGRTTGGRTTGGEPRRWRRWPVAALAAAAVVAAAVGGLVVGRAGAPAPQSAIRATTVSYGDGHWTCRVAAFPGAGGQPTELVIRVDEPSEANGAYRVEAEPVNGAAPVPVGTITVVRGVGVLDASVPSSAGKVDAIRVLTDTGELHYRAAFPAV